MACTDSPRKWGASGSFRQSPEKGVYTPEFVKFRAFLHKMACTDSPRKWGASGSFRQSPEKGVYTPEFVKFRAFLHKMACTDSPRKWGARGSPEKGGMPQHSFVLQCKLQLPWAMLGVFLSNFGSSLGFTNGRVNSYLFPTQSTLNNNIVYNMRTLMVSGVLVHRSTSRGQCV